MAKTKKRRQIKRTERGRFAPGTSGNPNGRPRTLPEFKLAAREHTSDALRVLAGIMKRSAVSPSARVRAAAELLDRGWGKAGQEVTLQAVMAQVDVSREWASLSREERMAQVRRLAFVLAEGAHDAGRAEKAG